MKQKVTIIIVGLLVAYILIPSLVSAQSPEKLNYQAVMRNLDNNLISNTDVGMQISILKDSTTGTAVYIETHVPTSNDNGLVTIDIGNGDIVLGDFSNINWANGTYFIKTETDLNGGTNYSISGTSQFLSVPYALFAKNVEPDYLSHVCLMTQNGTSDPTSNVIHNSLDIEITWTRSGVGKYFGVINTVIDITNAVFFITSPSSHIGFTAEFTSPASIYIEAMSGIGSCQDDFYDVPLEIKVYNN